MEPYFRIINNEDDQVTTFFYHLLLSLLLLPMLLLLSCLPSSCPLPLLSLSSISFPQTIYLLSQTFCSFCHSKCERSTIRNACKDNSELSCLVPLFMYFSSISCVQIESEPSCKACFFLSNLFFFLNKTHKN